MLSSVNRHVGRGQGEEEEEGKEGSGSSIDQKKLHQLLNRFRMQGGKNDRLEGEKTDFKVTDKSRE
jgi:hypothetical protein